MYREEISDVFMANLIALRRVRSRKRSRWKGHSFPTIVASSRNSDPPYGRALKGGIFESILTKQEVKDGNLAAAWRQLLELATCPSRVRSRGALNCVQHGLQFVGSYVKIFGFADLQIVRLGSSIGSRNGSQLRDQTARK